MMMQPAPVDFSLPYPPERLRWALEIVGWTQRELGRRLDIAEKSARDMATGRRNTPDSVGLWLESLAAMILSKPIPDGWRQGFGSLSTRAAYMRDDGSIRLQVPQLREGATACLAGGAYDDLGPGHDMK